MPPSMHLLRQMLYFSFLFHFADDTPRLRRFRRVFVVFARDSQPGYTPCQKARGFFAVSFAAAMLAVYFRHCRQFCRCCFAFSRHLMLRLIRSPFSLYSHYRCFDFPSLSTPDAAFAADAFFPIFAVSITPDGFQFFRFRCSFSPSFRFSFTIFFR